MTPVLRYRLRTGALDDGPQLSRLWALLFDEGDSTIEAWQWNARTWFAPFVADPCSPRGRTVRLANVITFPEYRGVGYGPAPRLAHRQDGQPCAAGFRTAAWRQAVRK